MSKKDIPTLTKENFLKIISSLDKDDIDRIITEKGKKPKLIKPLIRLSENSK
jgi:hypothetical protein